MDGAPGSGYSAQVNRPFLDRVEIMTVMVGGQRQDKVVKVWNH